MRFGNHKQRGFGLGDGLISLAVLSTGLLGLAQFQAAGFRDGAAIRTQTRALQIAQTRLERLRLQAANAISLSSGEEQLDAQAGDTARFTCRWQVSAASLPGLWNISVSTAWQDDSGTSQTTTLRSRLASGTSTGGS